MAIDPGRSDQADGQTWRLLRSETHRLTRLLEFRDDPKAYLAADYEPSM